MGKQQLFNDALTRIRSSRSAKDFRELYNSAQEQQLEPDVKTLDNLYREVDMALDMAKKAAESQLTDSRQVREVGGLTKLKDKQLQRGDLESAQRTNEQIRSYGNN